MHYGHYTDSELLNHLRNAPDDLPAQRELVERVVSGLFESDEIAKLEEQITDLQDGLAEARVSLG